MSKSCLSFLFQCLCSYNVLSISFTLSIITYGSTQAFNGGAFGLEFNGISHDYTEGGYEFENDNVCSAYIVASLVFNYTESKPVILLNSVSCFYQMIHEFRLHLERLNPVGVNAKSCYLKYFKFEVACRYYFHKILLAESGDLM